MKEEYNILYNISRIFIRNIFKALIIFLQNDFYITIRVGPKFAGREKDYPFTGYPVQFLLRNQLDGPKPDSPITGFKVQPQNPLWVYILYTFP